MQSPTWLKDIVDSMILGAAQLVAYLSEGRENIRQVPTQETNIAERFFDEGGGMQLIIHRLLVRRINKAWGLALRKRFCRSFNFELQAAATDDGLTISLAEQHSFPLADVFRFLHVNTLKEVLVQAVLQSPIFKIRWRWGAVRALALVRFRNGKKVPPNVMRILSDDLLAAVFPDAAACQDNLAGEDIQLPAHPLIDETMKDALQEALDLEGLIELIAKLADGQIECHAVDTPMPSAFSHGILNANPYAFLDDAPLEERRARAVQMRRSLPETIAQDLGRLDPLAIAETQKQCWPDIRDAEELHDALQTLIAFPVDIAQSEATKQSMNLFFSSLEKEGRAGVSSYQGITFWFAVEKLKTFLAIYPHAIIHTSLKEIEQKTPDFEEAILTLLRGWMLHLGPTTSQELSVALALNLSDIEQSIPQIRVQWFCFAWAF